MQAHARICEKINYNTKNDAYWNNFVATVVSLKDHIGRMGGCTYQDDILKDVSL